MCKLKFKCTSYVHWNFSYRCKCWGNVDKCIARYFLVTAAPFHDPENKDVMSGFLYIWKTWISRSYWLGKYPDTKKLKYPLISKRVEVSKYLCKYPNPSIQIQVSGYLPIWISGYQWKTINLYLDNYKKLLVDFVHFSTFFQRIPGY